MCVWIVFCDSLRFLVSVIMVMCGLLVRVVRSLRLVWFSLGIVLNFSRWGCCRIE